MSFSKFLVATVLGVFLSASIAQNTPTSANSPLVKIPEGKLVYEVYKAGKPAPTIMLGHGCDGVKKYHLDEYVSRVLSWGYNAIVVDSWTPREVSGTCKGQKPWYSPSDRIDEFYRIADIVSKESWHRGSFGYIGFSHGGSLGLNLAGDARPNTFTAIVSYYPNCAEYMVPRRQAKLNILVHFGGRDSWTPYEKCNDITGITDREFHPNATHSFDVNTSNRVFLGENLEHDPLATVRAFDRTRKFLADNLR